MGQMLVIDIEDRFSDKLKGASKRVSQRVITLTKNETLKNLKINTPVKKGKARGSWKSQRESPTEVIINSSAEYMSYLDKGTGIYGPRGTVITPKNGKVLTGWVYKDKTVFARHVKGIKPYKIVIKSIEATKPRISEFGRIAIREIGG